MESLYSGQRAVGHDRTVCQLGRVTLCQTTFFLPGGTIKTTKHPAVSAKSFTLKLEAGTRRYHGVTGTVKVHVVNRDTERESFKFV